MVINLSSGFPFILITLAQQQMEKDGRSYRLNHFNLLGVAVLSFPLTFVSKSHFVCMASMLSPVLSLSIKKSHLLWQGTPSLCCIWGC